MIKRRQALFAVSIVLILIGIGAMWYHISRNYEGFSNGEAQVTVVIPSVGRPTIDGALRSLQAQTNPNWRALVIYDGSDANPTVKDPRIDVIHNQKKGSAGATRNSAIPKIQTEWVAFLDDDDALTPDYIEKLLQTAHEMSNADIIVFRMRYNDGRILPEPGSGSVLRLAHVGISFAIRKKTFSDVLFKPIHAEDFYLLRDAFNSGKTIVLSEYLGYAVRPSDTIEWEEWQKFRDKREIVTGVVE
jgi:glycosyltransferase involved in cell wall biosynthesis